VCLLKKERKKESFLNISINIFIMVHAYAGRCLISLLVFLELTAQDEEVIARVFYTSAAVMQPIRHTIKTRIRLHAGTYCSIVKGERINREEMVQLVSFKTRHAA